MQHTVNNTTAVNLPVPGTPAVLTSYEVVAEDVRFTLASQFPFEAFDSHTKSNSGFRRCDDCGTMFVQVTCGVSADVETDEGISVKQFTGGYVVRTLNFYGENLEGLSEEQSMRVKIHALDFAYAQASKDLAVAAGESLLNDQRFPALADDANERLKAGVVRDFEHAMRNHTKFSIQEAVEKLG